jgi:hypothetical protein
MFCTVCLPCFSAKKSLEIKALVNKYQHYELTGFDGMDQPLSFEWCLKGHSQGKIVEIIHFYYRFGLDLCMLTLFKFSKSSFKKLRLFLWERS